MTKTPNTETFANAETVAEVRPLSEGEVEMVTGGVTYGGCIRIDIWGPLVTYNPWLDPYSPERRGQV